MISFIDEHRTVLGAEPICRLLPIAPSTYYEVVAKRKDVDRLSARTRRDMALKVEIRRVFNENFQSMACGKSGGSCSERVTTSPAAPSHGS